MTEANTFTYLKNGDFSIKKKKTSSFAFRKNLLGDFSFHSEMVEKSLWLVNEMKHKAIKHMVYVPVQLETILCVPLR